MSAGLDYLPTLGDIRGMNTWSYRKILSTAALCLGLICCRGAAPQRDAAATTDPGEGSGVAPDSIAADDVPVGADVPASQTDGSEEVGDEAQVALVDFPGVAVQVPDMVGFSYDAPSATFASTSGIHFGANTIVDPLPGATRAEVGAFVREVGGSLQMEYGAPPAIAFAPREGVRAQISVVGQRPGGRPGVTVAGGAQVLVFDEFSVIFAVINTGPFPGDRVAEVVEALAASRPRALTGAGQGDVDGIESVVLTMPPGWTGVFVDGRASWTRDDAVGFVELALAPGTQSSPSDERLRQLADDASARVTSNARADVDATASGVDCGGDGTFRWCRGVVQTTETLSYHVFGVADGGTWHMIGTATGNEAAIARPAFDAAVASMRPR